jgi:hypothetical protein
MTRFDFRNIRFFLPHLRTLKIDNNARECSYLKLMLAKLKELRIRVFDTSPEESGPNMAKIRIGCVKSKSKSNTKQHKPKPTSNWFNNIVEPILVVLACIAIVGSMIIKYARRQRDNLVKVTKNVIYSANNDPTSNAVEFNVVDSDARYFDPVDIPEQAESVGYVEVTVVDADTWYVDSSDT